MKGIYQRHEERVRELRANGDNGYTFDPANMVKLMDAAGITSGALSDGCGVSTGTIDAIRAYKYTPSVGILCKIADYFGVSVDYLLGRVDEATSKDVSEGYGRRFMSLRTESWEKYLTSGRSVPHTSFGRAPVAPWPYNLLEEIFGCGWCEPATDSQVAALAKAMSMYLSEDERRAVRLVFRDGASASRAGELLGVTRQSVSGRIESSVRRLRHPAVKRYIQMGGPEYISCRELELATEREREENRVRELLSTPIAKLDLSNRSFNALHDNGVEVAGEIAAMEKSEILAIHGLGRKSLHDITHAIHSIGLRMKWECVHVR